MADPLLSVRDLRTHFFDVDGVLRAVDGISFDVPAGEMLGIVGESGCGKSVTALSVMRLLPRNAARTISGAILFEGQDLLQLDESAMRDIRGNRIAMIFQEPMTALNPLLRVGEQIAEALRIHTGAGRRRARDGAAAMLRLVRIPDAERRLWAALVRPSKLTKPLLVGRREAAPMKRPRRSKPSWRWSSAMAASAASMYRTLPRKCSAR